MKLKLSRPRKRVVLIWGGALAVIAGLWLTDPDGGSSTRIWLLSVASTTLAVTLAYLARKGLFDYPEADMGELARKAATSPIGAAIVYAAICAVFIALLLVFAGAARAQDVRTYVPPPAVQLLPTLRAEQRTHWPDHPAPELLAALVEHESCISLKHSRCWNPASRLKSAREEGAGLGQITRTWRKDGTQRFDSLQDLVDKHPALAGWNWDNVYQRADLQLRAVVLMSRDNYRSLARVVREPPAVLAFADAAYNGGLAGVQNERRACAQVPGCDPQRWFGHVARHCLKSKAALYGQRSACDINRGHVVDVLLVRAPKYKSLVMSEAEIPGVKYAVNRQPPAESGIHRVVFDPEVLGPIKQIHSFPIELNQMNFLSVVGALLFRGSPPTVFWAVSFGPVDSINSHSRRAGTHVGQKVFKGSPSLTYADPFVEIVRRGGPVWNSASGMHPAPDVVRSGSGLPVLPSLVPRLFLQAAARLDVSAAQPCRTYHPSTTAIADTFPVIHTPVIADKFHDSQSTKFVSNLHGFHSGFLDVNMGIVNDVTQSGWF